MSYMEMIFLDSDDAARKTGVGCECETAAETWAKFRAARSLAVPISEAAFLLDYHNRKGDLADTIALSRDGFELITGERALSEDEYREFDRKFWDDILRAGSPGAASQVSP